MNLDKIKAVIKKKNGMLSDKQWDILQKKLEGREMSENDMADLKTYANTCALSSDSSEEGFEDDREEEPEEDESMEEEGEDKAVSMIEEALAMLKKKYSKDEELDG